MNTKMGLGPVKKTKVVRRAWQTAFIAVCLLFSFTALLGNISPAQAATGINEQVNFQARLLNNLGAVVADGTYNMRFKIYQDGDGVLGGGDETLKWTETRESTDKVTVRNGYFSVNLGSVTAFGSSVDWNQSVLWLSVDIGGTGSPSYDGEMSPFKRLSSNPYALNSGQLGGKTASNFVQLAQGLQTDASTSNASIAINKTVGTANILDLQRGGTSVLLISNGGSASFKTTTDSVTGFQVQDADGGTAVFNVDTDNERVGISDVAPDFRLDVAGDIRIQGTNKLFIGGTGAADNDVNLYRNNTNELKTDDYFFSAAQIAAEHGGATEVRLGAVGPSSESGLVLGFGQANPVNLYRSAADTLKTDDAFIVQGALTANALSTFTSDADFTLAGTENIAITTDLAGSVNTLSLVATPSSSAGTTRGFFIQQADSANTNGLDQALYIDNADTNLAISAAISIQNSGGGGYTTIIDNAGTLISGAELNLLDTHNVALVDIDDAVATAITGTGALNAGSITSGFGTIDNADTITGTTLNGTTGINTGATAGTQRIDASGNLVNIGNLTAAGAITIASTGAGNDITLNSIDQIILDGASATSLILSDYITDANGVLYTSTTGVLTRVEETETGSLCLLSGAGASGAPSWNTCPGGASDLDATYDADSDKQLDIDNASGLTFDLTTTGDFIIEDAGSAFLTISDIGGFAYTLDATDDPTFTITNAGAGDISFLIQDAGDIIFDHSAGSGDVLFVTDTGAYASFLDDGNIVFAPKPGSDFDIVQAAGTNTEVLASAAPTVDLFGVSNSGFATTTDTVDGLAINFLQGAGTAITNAGLNIAVSTTDNDSTLNGASISLTNASSGGTQNGLIITNVNDAANATTEALISLINNETTASTVTDGLIITSPGVNNGIVDAIDVSDSSITNAINVGNNVILGTSAVIDFSNFDLSGGGDIASSNTGSTNTRFDLVGTGDFVIRDGTTTFATFDDSGGITFAPNGTSDFVINQGTGVMTQIVGTTNHTVTLLEISNGSGTSSSGVHGVSIDFDQAADASGPDTNAALDIFARTFGDHANDILYGININLTNASTAAGTQNGLLITNANDAANATTEALIALNNLETTANSVTDYLIINTASADTTTDAIDVSDADFANALNVGANTITGAGYTVTSTASGLTINSTSANLALTTTTSGDITLNPAGNVVLSDLITDANAVLYATTAGVVTRVAETESANQCLLSGSGASGVPVWGSCSAGSTPDFDGVYAQTVTNTNFNMEIDDSGGLTFDLTNTGDFAIRDGTTAFATFDDSGGITFTPNGTSDLTFTGDSDSSLIISAGNIVTSNLGVEFTDSDTNPGCAAGEYKIYADTSETKLKKCADGTATDLDTGGAPTLISGDGAGATSSGSGMEFNGSDIGLLQGCSDDQILKWNESSAIWECASDRGTFHNVMNGDYTNATASFTDVDNNSDAADDMGFPVGANETWVFQMNAQHSSPTAADSQWQITAPSGATCDFANWINGVSVANIACGASSGNMATSGAADSALNQGTVVTNGTSGAVQLQFRQNAASGTSTIFSGSWVQAFKISGADLAEVYYSTAGFLEPGTVVVADPSIKAGVKPSGGRYDRTVLGVVSTQAGLILGESAGAGTAAPVALSGRVPVKVSIENGVIRPGDVLTTSSNPGIAMRSTKAGAVIGQALTGYDGDGVGEVTVFVKASYGTGSGVDELANGSNRSDPDFGKAILSTLMTDSEQLIASEDFSEIVTDTVVAGLEVITPRVTTDQVALNSIEAATSENIRINSDVVVNGTLTVDKIIANQIEGLEILTNKIGSIETAIGNQESGSSNQEEGGNEVLGSNNTQTVIPTEFGSVRIQTASISLDLSVQGTLTSSGALVVGGPAEFHGTTIFHKLARFVDKVIFNNDVEFVGTTTFNNSTGGYAVINPGQTEVAVNFAQPYITEPVVTVSIKNGQFTPYAYQELTPLGFKIVLTQTAIIPIEFSWTALSIQDPQVSQQP